jgi:DNA primase
MTIQEIKEQLSIGAVLDHYGLKAKKGHINCPFHEDKTPSMRVYEQTNTVYCFSGNCVTHGHSLDVIEFVQRKEQCTKREAILYCKKLLGKEEQTAAARPIDQIWEVLQRSLKKNARAKAYLEERGLSLEAVGYHSGHLAKSKLSEEAKLVGLINEKGRSWAKNCVLFPLRNAMGQIVSFYGRSLDKGHYYQTGRTGLFPCSPSKQAKKVILTESVIDAATLLEIKALKDYEVLALYGTNGFTKEHEQALLSLEQLEEVVLLLDGDEAGKIASLKYEQQLTKLLPLAKVRTVELPEGTDVNELWANHLKEELFVELLKVEAPAQPISNLETKKPNNLVYQGLHAQYYIKGFQSKSLDSLKVMLVVEHGEQKARGKVELYEDSEVHKYCRTAGKKLGLKTEVLETDISLLTDELEGYRMRFEQIDISHQQAVRPFEISPSARTRGKKFLKRENLLSRLNKLIGKTGIVGEERTRLLLFIVASSYKCEDPLHALIQGSSGTGKTLLMRKVMQGIPEPDRHIWTRISDKSLYHAGTKFKHSSVAMEDWDGLSEEVQYVVREMQSGGRLSSTITLKGENGKMDNAEILAEGPISSLMCTTRGAVYEDNMSRCLLVAVDESEEQTERILEYQYQKDRGAINKKLEEAATKQLQNLVYLLRPLEVVNPYAGRVELPKRVHKIRRLNQLFQCFVKQVTWLHQEQRERDKNGSLITTKEDLRVGIELLFETIILKVDELDGSLRQFFEQLKDYAEVQEKGGQQYCFGRREVRQAFNMSKTQQHRYLAQLLDLEYIKQVGGHRNRGYKYQIVYWDDNEQLRKQIKRELERQLEEIDGLDK